MEKIGNERKTYRLPRPGPKLSLKTILLPALLLTASLLSARQSQNRPAAATPYNHPLETTPPLGPLSGRNLHAPHLPWFSFPAQRAAAFPEGSLQIRTNISVINEFLAAPFEPADYTRDAQGRLTPGIQDRFTLLDYESTIWELGLDWQALENWRFSLDWRLHSRYGGFLDSVIESWHTLFGFSNAGREYFHQNRSAWLINLGNAINCSGSGTLVGSGDLDFRALWTFYSIPKLDLALTSAFKIPTDLKSAGYGSGYPDFGLSVSAEWRPHRRWILHGAASLIVPTGGALPMGQFTTALESRAAANLSILVQANIQTAPHPGTIQYIHPLFGRSTLFGLPQTAIKIGVKGTLAGFGWEVFVEEDPLTWEGPDIQVTFAITRLFNLPKFSQ